MTTCLVNLAYLDPARIGGVGRIAHEVSQLLAECADKSADTRVIFVVGWRFAGAFTAWLERSAVVVPFITVHDLRLTLQLLKPDVVISPLFGLEPFSHSKAVHITGMPDALALDHPELFSAADLAYRQKVYGQLSQASRVVTLSEDARERLLHHTALRPDQIVVVPLGAEPQIANQAATIPDLPERYVYYPANFWPHKRHDFLFRIMTRLWEQQPNIHLVLTGGRSDADRQGLKMLMSKYSCPPERVHDLGYVDDAQLTLLYRKAEALLFVSQYEGFGMPLLEAMQQGCPVICAPLAAIPEVVGEAGITVNGENVDDWVDAVLRQLPSQRENLIVAGRKRAAQFTWAKTRDGWREVVLEAGVTCDEHPPPTKSQTAEIAGHIQPLLEHISKLASSGNRWALLPMVFMLQMRVLWLARQYRSPK